MGEEVRNIAVPIFSASEWSLQSLVENKYIPENVDFLDITEGSLKELYEVKYPERKDHFVREEFEKFLRDNGTDIDTYGNLVYYEWRNLLMRIPVQDDLRLLRTARNQLLITPEEQNKLFSKTVLIAGMSVGSNVVEQLVHGGIGGSYILADMDTLEITNLNRIKVGLPDVTLPKALSSARRALEMDPYLNIVILPYGINADSLNKACSLASIDVFVDEVDDISAKVLLRQKAQELKIPLLMATDNSDGALIDIERYDSNAAQIMFNDRIPEAILQKMVNGDLSREESGAAIGTYFVGLDVVDNRLLASLLEVRKSIPSWPQLGTAASMSGILVAFATKQILLGEVLALDRYVACYDKDMTDGQNSEEYKSARDDLIRRMTTGGS